MIDRSYLPFKSAREYVDRGMAKWMGFFISEHMTALSKEGDEITLSNNMSEEEKLLIISQVYVHNVKISITVLKPSRKSDSLETLEGVISDISSNTIYFKTTDKIQTFPLSQVVKISLEQDVGYE